MGGFLIILIILAGFWVIAVLPRRRRLQSHRAMQDSLGPGDDVITAGGLHGRVDAVGDAEVRLEIADGVVVTVDRRAIAAVAADVPDDIPAEPDAEPDAGPAAEPAALPEHTEEPR